MNKKVLDVTTKGWSKEEITSFAKTVNKLNYRWEAKAVNKNGEIKWFHAFTKFDVEMFALQAGYKLLKVTRKN